MCDVIPHENLTRHKPTHTFAAFLCFIPKTQDFPKGGQLQWWVWCPCTPPRHYSPAEVVSGRRCRQRVHLVIVPPIRLSFVMCRVLWSDKTDTEKSLGRSKELQHVQHAAVQLLQCPWKLIQVKNNKERDFFIRNWKFQEMTLPWGVVLHVFNPFLLWSLSYY